VTEKTDSPRESFVLPPVSSRYSTLMPRALARPWPILVAALAMLGFAWQSWAMLLRGVESECFAT